MQQQQQDQQGLAGELVSCAAALHVVCLRCLLASFINVATQCSLALNACLPPSSRLMLSPLLQLKDLLLPGGSVLPLASILQNPAAAAAVATDKSAAAADDFLLLQLTLPPPRLFVGCGNSQADSSGNKNSSSSSNDGSSRQITVRLPTLSSRASPPFNAESLCSLLSSVSRIGCLLAVTVAVAATIAAAAVAVAPARVAAAFAAAAVAAAAKGTVYSSRGIAADGFSVEIPHSDIHAIASQHFGAWQRLCCSLCPAQQGLVMAMRMEWETFFCRRVSPFVLHRTVPAEPLVAAAALQQQQKQHKRRSEMQLRASQELSLAIEELKALGGVSAVGTPRGSQMRLEQAQKLLQVLLTKSETQQVAENWRHALHFLDRILPDILDSKLMTFVSDRPVVFEESYCSPFGTTCDPWCSGLGGASGPAAPQGFYPRRLCSSPADLPSFPTEEKGVHLFVFVHGFQGSPSDFRLFKATLCACYQQAACLSANANVDCTEGDIEDMGRRLAQEVLAHVKEFYGPDGLSKISFVGHSLGGIIVRAALSHLRGSLGSKFHLYLSLSSPHFGFLKGRSRLVSLGLWFLKKWRKSICLQQLTLSDNRDVRQCFLYRLSRCDALALFKHVCLVASAQDTYAPLHSAAMLPLPHHDTPAAQAAAQAAASAAAAAAKQSWRALSPKKTKGSRNRSREMQEPHPTSLSSSPSLTEALGGVAKVIEERPDGAPMAGPPTGPLGPPPCRPVAGDRVQRGPSAGSCSEDEGSSRLWSEETQKETDSSPQRLLPPADSEDDETQQQVNRQSHLLDLLSRNVAARIPNEKIMRLNVLFKIRDKSFDSFIGRAAHIQFLENESFMRMLILANPRLFR